MRRVAQRRAEGCSGGCGRSHVPDGVRVERKALPDDVAGHSSLLRECMLPCSVYPGMRSKSNAKLRRVTTKGAELKGNRATSSDVAKKAGVSRAAVSVVLNGAKANVRVSEQTRLRILAAAAELEYSPNPVAQSLRRQRSGTIAYVFRSLSDSLLERSVPYQLGRHIMSNAVSRGYQVIEINSSEQPSTRSEETLKLLLDRRVDGVVIGWPKSDSEVRSLVDHGILVVQVMKPQPADGSSTITVDPSQGIGAAVDHLVALGHERIAYLGNSDPHPVEDARLQCFENALKKYAIQIRKGYVTLGDCSMRQSQAQAHALLATTPEPPSALITVDSSVLGALRALYEADLRVPEDVSVICTDDLLASHLYPPLTSVVQPLEEVAERAMSLIEEQVLDPGGPDKWPSHIILPTRLKIRDSTKDPG